MSDEDMIRRGDAIARSTQWRRGLRGEDTIEDALRASPAVQVSVKPLEWKWSTQVQGWRADCELTRDVFIAYQTNEKWSAGSQWLGTTYHQTADAAKTHLDQMRAARIRSAIIATPARKEVMPSDAAEINGLPRTFDASPGVTAGAVPSPDVVEIDLRAVMMEEIEKAAGQSPWVPPEYTMNEIVSDCCSFLREPREPSPDVAALASFIEGERDYWIRLSEKDLALQNTLEIAMDYPMQRKMTEAMRKADAFTSALTRLKGGAGHSLDYERKVAQMKEDFPNGI